MTLLSLCFDCSSVNSYSPPRIQPYAFLHAAPEYLFRKTLDTKQGKGCHILTELVQVRFYQF